MKLAALATIALASAQIPVAFEVASVKPSKSDEKMKYGSRGSVLSGRNIPLKGWIQIAYGARDFQVVGPEWIANEKFDIEAKPPVVVSHAVMMQMLQALLADRFRLKLHRMTREMPVYELVVARGGLKMKASEDQTLWAGDYPNGAPMGQKTTGGGPTELSPGRLAGKALPMTILANLLSGPVERTVMNKTGLKGRYDVDLRYARDIDDVSAPSLFTALEEQLGLKLKAAKGPVEVLVVERVERPGEN